MSASIELCFITPDSILNFEQGILKLNGFVSVFKKDCYLLGPDEFGIWDITGLPTNFDEPEMNGIQKALSKYQSFSFQIESVLGYSHDFLIVRAPTFNHLSWCTSQKWLQMLLPSELNQFWELCGEFGTHLRAAYCFISVNFPIQGDWIQKIINNLAIPISIHFEEGVALVLHHPDLGGKPIRHESLLAPSSSVGGYLIQYSTICQWRGGSIP
ncbi:hypothetical protein [Tuwongella immobilis]|uniref:Uncharacterized protein n=1 Tax=Tuwongella immobilis TaxID=692036 RepID=A0A6C2YJI0_9BACT|nr:hypothetical protein [Tuwongella immobilis]VIP01524.1 unnamed protein product [Tuwongella immobilis]VTR98664.1 unnamed protein product [Tuwongella immobilis]